MKARTTMLPAGDGRVLCVESGGDPSGALVLVQGGSPNSRHLATDWLEDAERRGILLASYDRPGYGGSTSRPGRTVADCVDDVRAIAAAFGASRLATWGFSGGGPHVLACAALMPDLVASAAVLGCLAPYGAPGLDYVAGMGELNVEEFELVLDDPDAARRQIAHERELVLASTPEGLKEAWKSLLSPVDAAWLVGERLTESTAHIKDGLAPGDAGYWEDASAHMSPWGFAVEDVRVPVQLWHGAHDRMVPQQHGRWLAEHLSNVEPHFSEEDGHLTLTDRVPDVHDWLLRHL